MARIIGGAVTFNYADHLSTRVTTDLSGTPVRTYGHFPYGETSYETGAANDFKFTSYRRDANTGLDYADARYYSSRLGRFTSMDSVLGDNRYAYVNSDPINLVDPSGMTASCTTNPFELSTRPLCGPDQLGGGGGGGGGASCGINFDDGGFTVSFASGCTSFSVDFSGGMGGPFGNVQNTLQNLLAIILPIDTCPAGGFECPEDGAPLFGTPSCGQFCVMDLGQTDYQQISKDCYDQAWNTRRDAWREWWKGRTPKKDHVLTGAGAATAGGVTAGLSGAAAGIATTGGTFGLGLAGLAAWDSVEINEMQKKLDAAAAQNYAGCVATKVVNSVVNGK